MSSNSSSRMMRTPSNSRRQTLAPVTFKQANRNRRMTIDSSSAIPPRTTGSKANAAVAGKQQSAASTTTSKPRPRNSRASMIPRVGGRENNSMIPPPTPKGGVPMSSSSKNKNAMSNATAVASRRRTMGGGGGGGGLLYTHGSENKQSRRQSMLPPSVTAKDPRPLHDKGYQLQCSKKLLNFLVDNGYDHQIISLKTLKMPSRKDFISIVTFMLRLIDPTFQDGTMKLEEEISMYFRSLGYPFPISKTSLAAAGATHTWPALLGALMWLMETLQHNAPPPADATKAEDETETLESLEELEKKTDRTFFDYLGKAYMAFLSEDDTRTEELEQGLADEFEADNNMLVEEIDRVSDMNQTMVEQIDHLEKQFDELPAYDKKRNDYATDLEQFHDLIQQMNEHKAALELKVQERTAELAEKNVELQQLSEQKDALQHVIATQVLSVDDLPKLENAQKQADEAIVRTTKAKERLQALIGEYQDKLETGMADLDKNVSEYNRLLQELAATNPTRFKDDFGTATMKATFDKDKLHETATQDELLGVDLYEAVHPSIARHQRDLSSKSSETKAELDDHLDKVNKMEATNEEKAAKLNILLEKYGRSEGILLQQSESQDAVLAVRQREVAAMEQQVQSIQGETPSLAGTVEEQVAALERECAQLETVRLARQEEFVVQKKNVRSKIEQALNLMLQQEEYTQQRMAQLRDYWGNKRGAASAAGVLVSIKEPSSSAADLAKET